MQTQPGTPIRLKLRTRVTLFPPSCHGSQAHELRLIARPVRKEIGMNPDITVESP